MESIFILRMVRKDRYLDSLLPNIGLTATPQYGFERCVSQRYVLFMPHIFFTLNSIYIYIYQAERRRGIGSKLMENVRRFALTLVFFCAYVSYTHTYTCRLYKRRRVLNITLNIGTVDPRG